VFVFLLGTIGLKAVKNYNLSSKSNIVSPVPKSGNVLGQSSAISPTPTPEVKKLSAKVKRFSYTSSSTTTAAWKNDNFWNISKRMCGTGQYFETIQRLNGYSNIALQEGDVITIYCFE